MGEKINISSDKTYTAVLKNGFVCTIIDRITKINEHSLYFYSDGKVCTFTAGLPGDDRDYCISEILSNPLPELPTGYRWAGGWPTLKALKGNEYFLTNYPEYDNGYYGTDINNRNIMNGIERILLEKIEANIITDPPKEDPEEYVDITDLYPNMVARNGIDWYITESEIVVGGKWKVEVAINKESPKYGGYTIGEWYKDRQIRHRCKRKDLPVATTLVQKDTPKEYPVYYTLEPSYGNKFVVRTGDKRCDVISLSGKKYENTVWNQADDNYVAQNYYKLSSKEEYDKWLASLTPVVKYYIHNNRNIGDGYLSYVKQTGNEFVQYTFFGGVSKREPKAMPSILKESYTEVSEKEALEFHNATWPKSVYYSGSSDYKYIIRTSTNKYWGVNNSGKTVGPFEFNEEIREKICDSVYKLTNESEVVAFVKSSTVERSSTVVSTAPKVSKIKWATNYFITEPIVIISKAFAKSFRYVLLGTVIGSGVYATTHPEQVSRLIPKISIKVSVPPIIKG